MSAKRDRFIAKVRELANEKGLTVRVEKKRGKGGHAMIWIGSRVATLPAREIDPKTAAKIMKALKLD